MLIANKMESNGIPGKVKVSHDTKAMIESRVDSGFIFEQSDTVEVPAIGATIMTYFVECPDINDLSIGE